MDGNKLAELLNKVRQAADQTHEIDYVKIFDVGDMYAVTFLKDEVLEETSFTHGDYWWEVWEKLPFTYKHEDLLIALEKALENVEINFKIEYE